jgi:hypothetical protein
MAKLLVGHLTPTELELDTHFVPFSQEVFCMDDLDEIIMRINADAELQLLQLATLLVFVGFFLVLFLNVFVFAVINNFAHRGLSTGRHFYEVQPALLGHAQGLLGRKHAILLVGHAIHHADLGCTDALIDPGLVCITAVVTLGPATTAGPIKGRPAAAWLVTPSWPGRRCRAVDRCAGGTRSGCPGCRLRRGRIDVRTGAELAGAQVIEWIANG